MRRIVSPAFLLLALAGGRLLAAAEPAPAPPAEAIAVEEALDHVGEECTFEFVVEATRAIPEKHLCFLNSCRDHRDERNFTVVIFEAGLERLKADGIDAPAEHFDRATIRIHGVVEERKGRPQIVLEEPGQITVVKPAAAAAAAEE
ncbi:MAG: hypothetical protein ACKO4Z_13745 [Planctomycetota bacterium]